jgi:hypothetical protein
VNPAIHKNAGGFARFPPECSRTGGCTSVRALVFSFADVNPIPSGVVYTCQFRISLDVSPGESTIAVANLVLADPRGIRIAAGGIDGTVTVRAPE